MQPPRRRIGKPVGPANGNILIVEDEPQVAELLRRTLHDWQTTVVHSGREALAHLATQGDCDLVLCDITMPELTGVDVFEEATRQRPELAKRFLFICGGVTTDRAQRFLDREQPPMLWKPFVPEELRTSVRSMLADVTRS